VLFHCKPVNQQKTSIFAIILWEEQRLNCLRGKKKISSTFSVLSNSDHVGWMSGLPDTILKCKVLHVLSNPIKPICLGYFSEILFVEEYNICASSYIFFLKIVLDEIN
jgi:hypothetical protein